MYSHPVRIACLLLALLLVSVLHCPAAEISSVTYGTGGRVTRLQSLTGYVDITSELVLYPKGWKSPARQKQAQQVKVEQPEVYAYRGNLSLPTANLEFIQASKIQDGKLKMLVNASTRYYTTSEGLYWLFYVDAAAFEGGKAILYKAGSSAQTIPLPASANKSNHVLQKAYCRGIELLSASGSGVFLELSTGTDIELQDLRGTGQNRFAVFVPVASGNLRARQVYQFSLNLKLVEPMQIKPVEFSITPPEHPYTFEGFGGNYCFQLGSPVTEQTLQNLQSTRARIEMSLHLWEPVNDNSNPRQAEMKYYESVVAKNEELQEEFAMARRLAARKIPLVISAWHLPQWMYDGEPQENKYIAGRALRGGSAIWPEMIESIVSYLTYLKEKHGVEPELFSFNEPDLGIYVILSAEEHAEFIKALGAAMKTAGLKTKCLLGDNASYARCPEYWQPALKDPQAMQYIGAVSYHTWNVPSAETMKTLGEVARKFKLPLILGEVGTDPSAYHKHDYFIWEYALEEIRLYQNLLNFGQPSSLLYWEFTGDYPLFKLNKDKPIATKRYWLMRQYCNWLPENPIIQSIKGGNSDISLVALLGKDGTITLHLANLLGREAEVRVEGLPAGLRQLTGVVTGRDDNYRLLERVGVRNGKLAITLPPQSLTTLSRSLPTWRPPVAEATMKNE